MYADAQLSSPGTASYLNSRSSAASRLGGGCCVEIARRSIAHRNPNSLAGQATMMPRRQTRGLFGWD